MPTRTTGRSGPSGPSAEKGSRSSSGSGTPPAGGGRGKATPSGGVPIDPRIRERRITVRRDAGRRRLRRVAGFIAGLCFIAATVAAFRSPLLDVDRVEVLGATRTGAERVLAASRVRTGELMIDVDVDDVARRVAAVPTIGDVTVVRRWPGTVRLEVTERRAVAQLATPDGGWVLVDRRGRLLERRPERAPDLVVVEGTANGPLGAGLDRAGRSAVALAAELAEPVRSQVTAVTAGPEGAGLRLGESTVAELGGAGRRTQKLLALEALLAQPDRRCFATIRLGVPSAPALTRLPGCA